MNNSFGEIFRLTTFGESHGDSIGGVIDGMPSGITIDFEALKQAMSRRRPGSSRFVSARCETDEVKFISGIFEGTTTGTPIAFIINNTNQQSADYDQMRDLYRPSHADYTYEAKYGLRDHRGGGRSSARETACRVVAGELARQTLAPLGVEVDAFTLSIGSIATPFPQSINFEQRGLIAESRVRATTREASNAMENLIAEFAAKGDTLGGIVGCIVRNLPVGLGEPIYGKLQSQLASAMMSINAAKGFDYGSGFAGAACAGSEMADFMMPCENGGIEFTSNHSGGIQGGITNGQPVWFRVAFKPVATMMRPLPTVDKNGNSAVIQPRGRHDICVVPRAVAVVEAMTWMVLLDSWLKQSAYINLQNVRR